jgi:hypothetical protein
MAQLKAPVSDIQLKSGMLTTAKLNALTTTTEKEAAWTDSTYPSAKAVVDKLNETVPDKFEHPIGSIIITRTNANPGAKFGGTWDLIDKEFTNSVSSIGGPGNEVSPAGTGFHLAGETVIRTNHTLLLQIGVSVSTSSGITAKPNVEAITMATLDLSRYGISGLERGTGNEIAFATDANGTSGAICYYITKEGVLTLHDVIVAAGNRKLNNNTFMYISTVIPITDHTLMIDSFCNKFYWERTA